MTGGYRDRTHGVKGRVCFRGQAGAFATVGGSSKLALNEIGFVLGWAPWWVLDLPSCKFEP